MRTLGFVVGGLVVGSHLARRAIGTLDSRAATAAGRRVLWSSVRRPLPLLVVASCGLGLLAPDGGEGLGGGLGRHCASSSSSRARSRDRRAVAARRRVLVRPLADLVCSPSPLLILMFAAPSGGSWSRGRSPRSADNFMALQNRANATIAIG